MDPSLFSGSLVVTGGGTGGHFFPAVALAEAPGPAGPGGPSPSWAPGGASRAGCCPEPPGRTCCWTWRGSWGVPRGRPPARPGSWPWPADRLKAAWKRNRPWAVVGTGGYGSAPALLAARALGIPYFLHESNAQPGLLVKLLATGAPGVWCGMDAVRTRLPGARCVLAGTPVRVRPSCGSSCPSPGCSPRSGCWCWAAAAAPGPSTRRVLEPPRRCWSGSRTGTSCTRPARPATRPWPGPALPPPAPAGPLPGGHGPGDGGRQPGAHPVRRQHLRRTQGLRPARRSWSPCPAAPATTRS